MLYTADFCYYSLFYFLGFHVTLKYLIILDKMLSLIIICMKNLKHFPLQNSDTYIQLLSMYLERQGDLWRH